MGGVDRPRVDVGLWLRMAVAAIVAFLSLVAVLAVEFLLVSLLSIVGLALSYLVVLLAPVPDPLTRVSGVFLFAVGFVFLLHAYRLGGSIPRIVPTGFEPHAVVLLGLVSLWPLGWFLLRLEVSGGVLVMTLVVGLVLFGLLFAIRLARWWSESPEERWAPKIDEEGRVESSDPMVEAKPRVGEVIAEVRRSWRWLGDAAGKPGQLATVAASLVALWAVHARTASLSTERLFVSVGAIAGALAVVGHLGAVAYAERNRDSAVLRDAKAAAGPDELVPADLRPRVDRLAAVADVPPPDVRVGGARTPVAVTVGYRPETSTLIVSRGLLESLDDRELDAVLAHELAHVANRDAAVLTALAVPAARARASIEVFGSVPIVAVPSALATVASRWCVALVARRREYAADDGAVAITSNPAALASALETLDAELVTRPSRDLRASPAAAFSIVPPPWQEHRFFDRTRWFIARRVLGTHPPTTARIDRLRSIADERP